MKITGIRVYPYRYTPKGGAFMLSGGRMFTGFDSVIVAVDTDAGLVGWGEHASAPAYLDSLHQGAIAALRHLAPAITGMDPRGVTLVNDTMNAALRGHGYAKQAIDIACWDLLGKAASLPLSVLLGGVQQEELSVLNFVKMDSPDAMRARCDEFYDAGHRQVQIKVGGNWREDVERITTVWESAQRFDTVIVDANTWWTPREARLVLKAVSDLDIHIEQPCNTLESNLSVRRATEFPFILDEALDSLDALERAHSLDGFDAAGLKMSRFGGLSGVKDARDMCVRWGKPVNIDDMSGGEIIAATTAHLAASTPAKYVVTTSLNTTYVNESIASGLFSAGGRAKAPAGPGLGLEIDEAALGTPITM